jgi:hypothetical protein
MSDTLTIISAPPGPECTELCKPEVGLHGLRYPARRVEIGSEGSEFTPGWTIRDSPLAYGHGATKPLLITTVDVTRAEPYNIDRDWAIVTYQFSRPA